MRYYVSAIIQYPVQILHSLELCYSAVCTASLVVVFFVIHCNLYEMVDDGLHAVEFMGMIFIGVGVAQSVYCILSITDLILLLEI